MELAGRHALVTGGGSGIGAAAAQALAGAGCRVSILGRDEARLRAAVEQGWAADFRAADVTRPEECDVALDALQAAHGPFDILINNAGAAESAPLARTDRALWDRMLAVNLTAVFELTRRVLPGMVARGQGRVVTIASTAGLAGYPYVAAYVAAKHGAVGLTRALALEVARSGVTVNAVCPGFTETGLLDASLAGITHSTGRSADQARAALLRANPQGRFVQPREVAAAVLFLCGPGSDAMNGQAIAVAGGEVM